MAHVLVVATRYDSTTRITWSWASNLVKDLFNKGHHYNFIEGRAVSYTAIDHIIPSADFVLFYGHGEPDRFIGQKGLLSFGSGPPLVNTTNVSVFQGRPVYAVCCLALGRLGSEYAHMFPQGAFIGYDGNFAFSYKIPTYFEGVVNQAALDLVDGTPPRQVYNDIQTAWDTLSVALLKGTLPVNVQDGFAAAFSAYTNARTVGIKP